MAGGHGIAHSEVSIPDTDVIHGVQLWVALPEEHRQAARHFQHHVPEPVRADGAEIKVFLGSLAGCAAPVRTCPPAGRRDHPRTAGDGHARRGPRPRTRPSWWTAVMSA